MPFFLHTCAAFAWWWMRMVEWELGSLLRLLIDVGWCELSEWFLFRFLSMCKIIRVTDLVGIQVGGRRLHWLFLIHSNCSVNRFTRVIDVCDVTWTNTEMFFTVWCQMFPFAQRMDQHVIFSFSFSSEFALTYWHPFSSHGSLTMIYLQFN